MDLQALRIERRRQAASVMLRAPAGTLATFHRGAAGYTVTRAIREVTGEAVSCARAGLAAATQAAASATAVVEARGRRDGFTVGLR